MLSEDTKPYKNVRCMQVSLNEARAFEQSYIKKNRQCGRSLKEQEQHWGLFGKWNFDGKFRNLRNLHALYHSLHVWHTQFGG